MKNSYILLFICSMLFLGCKKNMPESPRSYPKWPTTYFKLNPPALDFIQLPVGRYYSYVDSATGRIDTVRVSLSIIEKKFQTGIPGSSNPICVGMCTGTLDQYYQEYGLRMSLINGQDWLRYKASSKIDNLIYYAGDTVITSGSMSFESQLPLAVNFWYPFESSGQVHLHFTLPLLSINGTSFQEVRVFSAYNGLDPTDINYQAIKTYWVKGIGMIKNEIRTYNSTRTCSLVNYW